ncbi:MAG: DUF1738 domain-containing protein, partial [Armatimonadetes bacterium]
MVCGIGRSLRPWPYGRLVRPGATMSTHLQSRGSPSATYQLVTDRILEALNRGAVPWRKPWKGREQLPCNALTKRPYHGINLLLLGLSPFVDHRWLTLRQANEAGGQIKC